MDIMSERVRDLLPDGETLKGLACRTSHVYSHMQVYNTLFESRADAKQEGTRWKGTMRFGTTAGNWMFVFSRSVPFRRPALR